MRIRCLALVPEFSPVDVFGCLVSLWLTGGAPQPRGKGPSGEAFVGRAADKGAGLASALPPVAWGGVIANVLAHPFASHSSYYAFIFGLSFIPLLFLDSP